MRILITDDEKNIRELLRDELATMASRVAMAENGLKALELLEKEEFDILLLDMNMPGLNGLEVLKKLKSQDIPTEVVILTAHATIQTAIEAMKLGAYDYLLKPFKIAELTPVLERRTKKRSSAPRTFCSRPRSKNNPRSVP